MAQKKRTFCCAFSVTNGVSFIILLATMELIGCLLTITEVIDKQNAGYI